MRVETLQALRNVATELFGLEMSVTLGCSLRVFAQRRDGPIPLDASFARKFVVEDGYNRLDLMAGYATRIFQRRVKFQINVDNVTDEFYADKSLGYANPRTWRVSARA